jgi:hypothetical protein
LILLVCSDYQQSYVGKGVPVERKERQVAVRAGAPAGKNNSKFQFLSLKIFRSYCPLLHSKVTHSGEGTTENQQLLLSKVKLI